MITPMVQYSTFGASRGPYSGTPACLKIARLHVEVEETMRARFLLEIEHRDHLAEIFESIMSVPGVISVERKDNK